MTDLAVFVLPAKDRERFIESFTRRLMSLPPRQWAITVAQKKKRRSSSQNSYLWGVVYPTILSEGGEDLRGWTVHDLHEFFLIDHFGSETLEGFGKKRLKPLKRSAKLTTTEFMDFCAHIQQFMAERGVVIPDPNEDVQ